MQGDCDRPYVDENLDLEPPLPEWDPELRQCVVILPEAGQDSSNTSMLFVKHTTMGLEGVACCTVH